MAQFPSTGLGRRRQREGEGRFDLDAVGVDADPLHQAPDRGLPASGVEAIEAASGQGAVADQRRMRIGLGLAGVEPGLRLGDYVLEAGDLGLHPRPPGIELGLETAPAR